MANLQLPLLRPRTCLANDSETQYGELLGRDIMLQRWQSHARWLLDWLVETVNLNAYMDSTLRVRNPFMPASRYYFEYQCGIKPM